jgi:hypothetical protein
MYLCVELCVWVSSCGCAELRRLVVVAWPRLPMIAGGDDPHWAGGSEEQLKPQAAEKEAAEGAAVQVEPEGDLHDARHALLQVSGAVPWGEGLAWVALCVAREI